MIHSLFVYGTLRKGSIAERSLWLSDTARYAGAAHIRGRLYRVKEYPGLGPAETTDDWVRGDLFENLTPSALKELDEFEGLEYQREAAEVRTEEGATVNAFVYRYTAPTAGLQWIYSGDWKQFNPSSFLPE